MNPEGALDRLLEPAAAAVAGVLGRVVSAELSSPTGRVVASDAIDLGDLGSPFVAATVAAREGLAATVVLCSTFEGARSLISEDGRGTEPAELADTEVGPLGTVVGEAGAAALTAMGVALSRSVSPGEVEVTTAEGSDFPAASESPLVAVAALEVQDLPWRILVFIPEADQAGLVEALDAHPTAPDPDLPGDVIKGDSLADSLRELPVRLEAELGRTLMPIGRLVSLPPGAVVELDRLADEPLQIFVNGMPFATGRLIVVDDTEWAVQLEEVVGVQAAAVSDA